MRKLILASSSPRRKDLLTMLHIPFSVVHSNIDEKLNPRFKPTAQAAALSLQKAEAVADKHPDAIILAADTLVVVEGEILGKPGNIEDAQRMLRKLRGKTHQVITGFTVLDTKIRKHVTKSEETSVTMKYFTHREIDQYISKENVFDKAGAYAIQGVGSVLIERVDGDFFNVIGLPIFAVSNELKRFGITIL